MRKTILTLLALTIIAAMLVGPGLAAPPKEGGGETLFLQLDLSGVEVAEGMSRAQVLGAYRLHQGLQMKRVIGFLASLKDQGLVASFQPDFDANGILVTTTGAEGVAALSSSPGLFTTTAASPEAQERSAEVFHAAMWTQMKNADTTVIEAASTFWTWMQLGNSWLSGTVAPNTLVRVTLKDRSGNVIATARARSDGDGDWETSFRNWQEVYPGYRVTVRAGGVSKSVRVPRLTIFANRDTDVSSGKAPANKTVYVGLGHWYLTNSGWKRRWYEHTVGTNGLGNYSYDFTGDVNMRGDDWAYVTYCPNDNWCIDRGVTVPQVSALLGHPTAWGHFEPLTQATVVLKDSANVEKARVVYRTDYWGWFDVDFYDGSGNPVMVKPGDKITVSGSGGITARPINLTAKANAKADTVSGKAKPNKRVGIGLRHYTSEYDYYYYYRYPKANTKGNYLADFTSLVNMAVNDAGYVYYQDPRTGDATEVAFIAQ